jgi:hypothetical protein
MAEGGDDIIADAARVRDVGIFANPDSFVDTAAQMLREVSVDFRLNSGTGTVSVDRKRRSY